MASPTSFCARLTIVFCACWLMLPVNSVLTMAAAMASLRMPCSLALTDVCVVSFNEMRLVIWSSVALDQLVCQPEPRNCGSTAVVMKSSI